MILKDTLARAGKFVDPIICLILHGDGVVCW